MGVTQIPLEEICKMTPFEILILEEALSLKEKYEDNKITYAMLVEKK